MGTGKAQPLLARTLRSTGSCMSNISNQTQIRGA